MADQRALRLDRIYSAYAGDGAFKELRESASRLVPGSGSLEPSAVFVGEAPGSTEDRLGQPFTGMAGSLLNAMLEHIGLRRADVYITNLVKYRPPDNRDPSREEAKASLPYLFEEIRVLRPEVLVTLGRFAFNAVLPYPKLSKVRGQPIRLTSKLVLLPMWHPAYILRNRQLRVVMEEDFDTLKGLL